MGKGNQFKKSIIYRNNLQDTIMELHCRGLCYSEICRVINDKTGLHINRMQISRHLSSVKPDDLKRNTISNLKGIRDRTTENLNKMKALKALDDLFRRQESVMHTGQLLGERPEAGGDLGVVGGGAGVGFEGVAAHSHEAAGADEVSAVDVRGDSRV